MITLKNAMQMLNGEPWTVATEKGDGWIYYFDGKELHDGSHDFPLEELLKRECVQVYERAGRKYWSDQDRKHFSYMELEAGLAFIVTGRESGTI